MPESWWEAFFSGNETFAKLWGPLVGPLVAVLSFVCSIGNVSLAAVLWNGGISFGGVIAFIYADLIVLPILNIYRKYYGLRVAAFLLVTFYAALPAPFSYEVGNRMETWGEGIEVFHNPNAVEPLLSGVFPDAVDHRLEEGLIVATMPPFHPFASLTIVTRRR